ncbi:MAG: hypothetical protein ACM3XN_06435 [Chloroflexota bacterium]
MPYLSELKIQEAAVVRKVRRLPLPGNIHVQVGDAVTARQEVARTELLPGEPSVVDVGKQLKVEPAEIRDYVLVAVGDSVKRNQEIARRRRPAIEGGDAVVYSPCEGVVEHISEAYGQVLIREAGDPVNAEVTVDLKAQLGVAGLFQSIDFRVRVGDEVQLGRPIAYVEGGGGWITAPVTGTVTGIDGGVVRIRKAYKPAVVEAYIPGRVVAVDPGESVTIETLAAFVQGIFGIGGEQHGEIKIAVAGPADELTPNLITAEAKGKVVVGGAFASYDAIAKAMRVGAVGLIVGGARAADLSRVAGRNIGVGVTGSEDIGLSVVLTEGFGSLRMADRTFNLLRAHAGDACSLSGSSQIRAGVIRPEIIIPLADGAAASDQPRSGAAQLKVGSLVRIIRKPYFGLWGRVSRLPGAPVPLPTGASMPVLAVTLEDGRTVEVLENNVELFPF